MRKIISQTKAVQVKGLSKFYFAVQETFFPEKEKQDIYGSSLYALKGASFFDVDRELPFWETVTSAEDYVCPSAVLLGDNGKIWIYTSGSAVPYNSRKHCLSDEAKRLIKVGPSGKYPWTNLPSLLADDNAEVMVLKTANGEDRNTFVRTSFGCFLLGCQEGFQRLLDAGVISTDGKFNRVDLPIQLARQDRHVVNTLIKKFSR